jgi:hypothetical protein
LTFALCTLTFDLAELTVLGLAQDFAVAEMRPASRWPSIRLPALDAVHN